MRLPGVSSMATQTEASDYLRRGFGTASVECARSRASTPRRNIATVGVDRAGTMGSGIAMVFANAELPVTLIEKDADGLAPRDRPDRRRLRTRAHKGHAARAGRLTARRPAHHRIAPPRRPCATLI